MILLSPKQETCNTEKVNKNVLFSLETLPGAHSNEINIVEDRLQIKKLSNLIFNNVIFLE